MTIFIKTRIFVKVREGRKEERKEGREEGRKGAREEGRKGGRKEERKGGREEGRKGGRECKACLSLGSPRWAQKPAVITERE